MDQKPRTKAEKPYLHETERGDALAGRTLTAILPTEDEHCAIPPHFPPSLDIRAHLKDIIDKYGMYVSHFMLKSHN
jgi:hypothetical protein